jgi:hypothetical protein
MRLGADTELLDALAKGRHVVGEDAEAQVLQLLGGAGREHRAPMVRVAGGVEVEPLTDASHVEAERAVKALGGIELGHGEDEAVERVHAEHAGAAGRWGFGGVGHRATPGLKASQRV